MSVRPVAVDGLAQIDCRRPVIDVRGSMGYVEIVIAETAGSLGLEVQGQAVRRKRWTAIET